MPFISFYTILKQQKNCGLLIFAGGIERDQYMKSVKQRQTKSVSIGKKFYDSAKRKRQSLREKKLLENLSKNNLKICYHLITQIRKGNVKETIEPL